MPRQTYLDFLRVRDLNASNSCSDHLEWRPSPGPSSAHGRWGVRRDEPRGGHAPVPFEVRASVAPDRGRESVHLGTKSVHPHLPASGPVAPLFPSAGLAFSGPETAERISLLSFRRWNARAFCECMIFFTPGIQVHQFLSSTRVKAREEARDRRVRARRRTQPGGAGRLRRWGVGTG